MVSDTLGNQLDMGTHYDYIGELAYPRKEQQLLAAGGKLTQRRHQAAAALATAVEAELAELAMPKQRVLLVGVSSGLGLMVAERSPSSARRRMRNDFLCWASGR